MKYIVVKDEFNKEYPITFPSELNHCDLRRLHNVNSLRIVSAGHYEIRQDGQLYAYGRSESLDIDGRPQDTALLRKYMT